jgi:putative ABC transport system permease protein
MPPIRSQEDEERVRNNPLLTLEEADIVRAGGPSIDAVVAQAGRQATISYRDEEVTNARVEGVTASYLDFATYTAGLGRMMSAIEVERSRPVALIGPDLAESLFGATDPLEKTIRIAGIHFRVVGVGERKGAIFGNSQDNYAIVPLGAYMKLFGARQSLSLMVKPESPDVLQAAMDEATVALRVHRRLKPAEPDNFGIFTSDTILNLYRQATNGIFGVLVGVVALSLVVGGIVIMNIMLMVVSERTREIGLRKALGAKRRDIMSQVLTESVTLSTFGGLIGVGFGFLLAMLIAAVSPLPARLEWWSVVLGIGITAGVGLFFGAYPASRAARLDPIEALRRE